MHFEVTLVIYSYFLNFLCGCSEILEIYQKTISECVYFFRQLDFIMHT